MEFVGRTLKKQFQGFGPYSGVVESYDSSTGLFKITYEDGDSEELDFGEVASILKGIEEGGAAEPIRGRKPKKRRLGEPDMEIRDGSGNTIDSFIDDCCSGEGYEETQMKNDVIRGRFSETLEKECGLGGNLKESVSTNGNLKDCDSFDKKLSKSVCSDGLNPYVSFDEKLEKIAYSDGNLDGNDPVGSAKGNPKKECAFDVNFNFHEETKMNNNISGGDFVERPPFEVIEETQMKEVGVGGDFEKTSSFISVEETQMERGISNGSLKEVKSEAAEEAQLKESTGFGDHMMDDACLDMVEGFRKEDGNFSVELKGSASSEGFEATYSNDSSLAVLQLHEDSSDAGFAEKGNQNDLGCPGKEEHSRKKRRRLSENQNSSEETVLRRSARRAMSNFSYMNHVSGMEESPAADAISSPVANAISSPVADAISSPAADAISSPAVNDVSDGKSISTGCGRLEEPSNLYPKLALPPSSKNLNLDEIPVLDIFSVYACLRSFSTLLFLSPFDLEAFVAALKCKFANSLIDFIHLSILQTLKLHLEFLCDEGSQSASACLRNLNWGLLDLITWPVFMVEYLLIRGSGLKPGFDLSGLKLLDGDYYKQPAAVKVEILRCLCDDVIEAEAIRLELNRRTLASDLEMDADRGANAEIYKRRKDPVDDSSGSCLTQEVVEETTDWNSDECCLCKMDGSLICCDGCPAAYHLRCVGTAKDLLPEGDWYCPECVIGKHDPWTKPPKSLRGAELLGVDPHGRLYFGSCGYLLVSDSCDTYSSYYYYNRNDLNTVIEVLKSSEILYGGIISAISMQWDISVNSTGVAGQSDSQTLTVGTDVNMEVHIPAHYLLSTMPLSATDGGKHKDVDERKLNEKAVTTEGFGHQICKVSESVSRLDSVSMNQVIEMASPFASSECSAEISQAATGIQLSLKTVADCSDKCVSTPDESEIPEKLHCDIEAHSLKLADGDIKQENNSGSAVPSHSSLGINPREGAVSQMQFEPGCYVNSYSFAQTAASVAKELMRKSSDTINEDSKRSAEENISAQLRVISKNSSKFCWSNIQRLYMDGQKENCGWCFSCKSSSESEICLFNTIDKYTPEGSKSEAVAFCSKRNRKSHLIDVICHILSIEDRLRGLLSGPWQNPHHSKQWRKSILKASDVASVKHLLLVLESNLRRIAVSAEWFKHIDSVVAMGSASCVMTTSFDVSSKHGIGKKRARFSDADSKPNSNAATRSGIFWWRGGRLSRQVFHWKVLPRSLASKGGRQAGCMKIPGILYPDGSEFAKRSRCIAWRAALEMSTSVTQLAFQVRELDSNIRWDDLESNQLFSQLAKESRKLMRPFKKVTIRRKCTEGTYVKYLLDFGKRKTIPDTVIKHGIMLEVSSSERKKYWLDESHVPLSLLKAFEEKRLARMSNKKNPGKIHDEGGRVMKKPSKKRGLSYLLSKGEISENYQCGHCNKDVLIREAVNCQYCKGFFHKRHARKSNGTIAADCMYTCHKCQDVKLKHVKKKMKGKIQLQKSKKGSKDGRPVRSQNSKKAPPDGRLVRSQISKKNPTDGRPVRSPNSKKISTDVTEQSQNSKKASVDRRSVRSKSSKKVSTSGRPKRSVKKVKYAPVKSKRIGRKKRKHVQYKNRMLKKSEKSICWHTGKRTQVYHAYWINGLRLSRKANDEHVIPFRERKLLLPSQNSSATLVLPKCCLCREAGYTSTLVYVGCENCEDWFHGDAMGLTEEKIGNLLGFRCHRCRKKNPPVCPHLLDGVVNGIQLHKVNDNAGMECVKDVSDIDIFSIERYDQEICPCEDSSRLFHMHASVHEQSVDVVPDSNQTILMDISKESKNGHVSANNEQKEDATPDSINKEQKADTVPDFNQTFISEEYKTGSEKRHIVSVELLVKARYPSCKSDEDVIETGLESLGNMKMEEGLVEMTAIPEMLVAGTFGDSSESHRQTTQSSTGILDTGEDKV